MDLGCSFLFTLVVWFVIEERAATKISVTCPVFWDPVYSWKNIQALLKADR